MDQAPKPPLRIGRVTLTVHDLQAVSGFYQSHLGLHPLAAGPDHATLGAAATPLLELRRDPAARRHSPREAGLFHTAFLLPGRTHLGRWLRHATTHGITLQGAADHGVSEALYLSDPEGNGIEVYADRPRQAWTRQGPLVPMHNGPLDLPALAALGAETPWQAAPPGTTIGHVHLQVGDLPTAEAFYQGRLGIPLTWRYEKARFFGSGGYHHHIAANVWNSPSAPPRDFPVTGLAQIELLTPDPALLRSLAEPGLPPAADGALTLHDPWRTPIRVAIG